MLREAFLDGRWRGEQEESGGKGDASESEFHPRCIVQLT
jgi:hypothetical protein